MKRISTLLLYMCLLHVNATGQTGPGDQTEVITLKANQKDSDYVKKLLSQGIKMESVDLDSALQLYLRAKKISKLIHYATGVAKGYEYTGIVNADKGAYAKAIVYYDSAITVYGDIEDSVGIGACYLNIANVYQFQGDYSRSMQYYFRSLRLLEPLRDYSMLSVAYSNLGVIFQKLKQYKKAKTYYSKAVDISRERNDSVSLGNGLINLGAVNTLLNKNKKAMTAFLEAKNIGTQINNPLMLRDALTNIGGIYFKENRPEIGLSKLKLALKYANQIGYPYDIASILNALGENLFNMGRYGESKAYLLRALDMARSIHSNTLLTSIYSDLAQLYFQAHDYRQAYVYDTLYKKYSDSVFSADNVRIVNNIETKYQTEKKNKEIAEKNLKLAENRATIKQKNTWIFIILGGLLALLAILILSVRSYRHKRNLHQQSLLTLQKQHELNTLKTKMDAREEERNRIGREIHDDVGSALTTILYLSDDLKSKTRADGKQTAERIADTAGSVVDKMNEIIWSMNREYDTLDDLIAYTRQHAAEFLDNYKLTYRFETPDPIPDIHLQGEQRRNIYLVIKETLHNVVKHACATEVNISFHLNDCLAVIIHDNGKGINTGELRRFGNGLRNMKQRMESIGGSFDIINEEGTTVKLQCPLEREQNLEASA